jgi:tRNA modification GTPase
LNGRLDLTRAEALSDLVTARSRRAAQLAVAGLDGGLQRCITALRERLLDQLAELEARVDFEENLPTLDGGAVGAALAAVAAALRQLVTDGDRSLLLREGLRVAIIGRPNVGKSSLLNALSRSERAIVADGPGTTRDLIDSAVMINGVPLTLLDTAGIRRTDDPVERLGIARSREALASADAVLLLHDLSEGWTAADEALRAEVPEGLPLLLVGNKADRVPAAAGAGLAISARDGTGLAELGQALLACCGATDTGNLALALNRRQRDLAAAAAAALDRSLEAADGGLPWDFWTIDLREAIRLLGEITGDELSEAMLDRVFSRFCIGK